MRKEHTANMGTNLPLETPVSIEDTGVADAAKEITAALGEHNALSRPIMPRNFGLPRRYEITAFRPKPRKSWAGEILAGAILSAFILALIVFAGIMQ